MSLRLLPRTLSPADVQAAAARIEGEVVRTPSTRSETLSRITGADVAVKFENLQFTASFKDRGAANRLLALRPDERAKGVVAVSAGNHAQAVAYHAARLGVPATVVMPTSTPFTKVARTRRHGARVLLEGPDLAAAAVTARRLSTDEGLTFVPPYDCALVAAGQGTVALELLDDHPDLEVLVVPVGGGGLVAGCAVVAASRGVEVVGVQTERWPGVANVLDGGDRRVGGETVAEGIAVAGPGPFTAPLVRQYVHDVILVDEPGVEQAIGMYLEIEKVVAEGAGAAPLAALLARPERFAGRRVGLVLSGGNIDPRLLSSVILRAMARDGRLCTVFVEILDRPGALAAVARVIADLGGNVVELAHHRDRPALGLRAAELAITVETTDRAHADAIAEALRATGFAVRVASSA